jgi:hypothetical protein
VLVEKVASFLTPLQAFFIVPEKKVLANPTNLCAITFLRASITATAYEGALLAKGPVFTATIFCKSDNLRMIFIE